MRTASTVAATSCVLITLAPVHTAIAVAAMLPYSRSPGGFPSTSPTKDFLESAASKGF